MTVLNGSGAPGLRTGDVGDFYIDTTTNTIYGPKGRGERIWPGPTSLVGPTGATGETGAAGPNGRTVLSGSGAPAPSTGNTGDFYIDTTGNRIYGPKTTYGGWGPATSLKGSTGAAGADGATGATGATGAKGYTGDAGAVGSQGPAGPSNGYFRSYTAPSGSGETSTEFTLPVGYYIVSYAANVHNADPFTPLQASCKVTTGGSVFDPGTSSITLLNGMSGVIANTMGLEIPSLVGVRLFCGNTTGSGAFRSSNIQLTAIKVASLYASYS
jgi:hypothetical protein